MEDIWYDVNQTLSHNCLINFVVGPRGVGKTYSCKKRVIKDYITKGWQFVYLRRYDTELKPSEMEKWFDDVRVEFPGTDTYYKSGKFFVDDECAGYAIPLSLAAQFKSVPFPRVMWIIFDEFIIDQGFIRYLPNEVHTFCEMYSTIARLRDVKVLALSNSITFTNPYFLFFDLKLQQGQKLVKKGDILLELVENPGYQERAANTRFGRIIADTDYGKYAIQNQFLRDSNTFIAKMPGPGNCIMILKVGDQSFGVYSCLGEDNWYVSESLDSSCRRVISLDMNSHDTNTILKGDPAATLWIEQLKQKYYRAEVRFTTMKAKNLISEIIRRNK